MENSMEFQGIQWNSEVDGIPWNMEFHGIPWNFVNWRNLMEFGFDRAAPLVTSLTQKLATYNTQKSQGTPLLLVISLTQKLATSNTPIKSRNTLRSKHRSATRRAASSAVSYFTHSETGYIYYWNKVRVHHCR
jgi:hypothetical protein